MRNRLILLAVIVALAATAYFAGFYETIDPDRLRALLSATGAWGPAIIVVLFSLLQPFGAPGAIFMLAAATLWPFWLALGVNWIGATGAGMFGFAFARYVGRDWVERRMSPRLRSWDARLSNGGLRVVVFFRLVFFLNPVSHWVLGLSRVPARTAILGTAIGFLPGVIAFTYFGAEILEWIGAQSIEIWLSIGGIVAAIIAIRALRKRGTPPASAPDSP